MESKRPGSRDHEAVYSNFDHEINLEAASRLAKNPDLYAQHAAWDFCGYVWRGADGVWREEVWQYKEPVDLFEAEEVADVIAQANEKYGAA